MIDANFSTASNAYANTANRKTFSDGLGTSNEDISVASNDKPNFGELVSTAISEAKGAGYQSESISAAAIAGETGLQDVATALTNAEMTLETVVAVRDKVVSAYQDIIKMPI